MQDYKAMNPVTHNEAMREVLEAYAQKATTDEERKRIEQERQRFGEGANIFGNFFTYLGYQFGQRNPQAFYQYQTPITATRNLLANHVLGSFLNPNATAPPTPPQPVPVMVQMQPAQPLYPNMQPQQNPINAPPVAYNQSYYGNPTVMQQPQQPILPPQPVPPAQPMYYPRPSYTPAYAVNSFAGQSYAYGPQPGQYPPPPQGYH